MTDVEERVTRWKEGRGGGGRYAKEGQGGRRDEESEKKMKNEKVAKGRIIGLAGPCFIFDCLCT